MPVSGQIKEYQAVYDIYSNDILVELNIILDEHQKTLEINIPKDAEAIEVDKFKFEVVKLDNKNKLIIQDPINSVNIKYITSSFIDKSKEDRFFILSLNQEKEVTLKLPEKAVLKYSLNSLEQSVFPKTNNISTDGKRIIINWKENDLKQSSSILVIYNQKESFNFLFWLALGLIFILLFIFFKYFRYYKKEPDITRNLLDEEKKIISALLKEKNKELWQKQLELKTGISKVRLSRKLRNLEEKGLIEKTPYGNTNKVKIK